MTIRVHANPHEIIAINDKLKDVCRLQEGHAVYSDGWDDERVRAVVAPRLNKLHVARLRNDIIGKLPPKAEPDCDRISHLEKRVDDLNTLVLELYRRLGETV